MRIAQQKTTSGFDYKTFKRLVDQEDLKESQIVPPQQRLDTLESFMDPSRRAFWPASAFAAPWRQRPYRRNDRLDSHLRLGLLGVDIARARS